MPRHYVPRVNLLDLFSEAGVMGIDATIEAIRDLKGRYANLEIQHDRLSDEVERLTTALADMRNERDFWHAQAQRRDIERHREQMAGG